MSGPTLGIYGIVVMLVGLLFLRIPAGFIMALVGFIGLAIATSFRASLGLLGSEFWSIFSSYGLTVIPMFILVGEFIYHAGYSDNLYKATYKWFGHRKGGLAITTILASAGFSAICGSNNATAATMSAVAIPSMRKYGYHPTLKAGAVAAGSTLGVMIPPSIVLVVYGLDRGQSIPKLFFGTLIPSALLTLLMAITVIIICRMHPDWGPAGEKTGWREKLLALPGVLDILILFIVIMAALYSGKVTATEAAAVSAFLGLVSCVIRRKLNWEKFKLAIYDTLRISCMVFMIVAGAVIFGRFMTITRLPFEAAQWIRDLNLPGWMILVIIMLFYAVGGCLMDALAFLLISLPIFYPVVMEMGYDPVWFGVLICVITTLGAITPPIGICCYVISGRSGIPVERVFRGSLYYIPAYAITIALLIMFPYWTVMILSNLVN